MKIGLGRRVERLVESAGVGDKPLVGAVIILQPGETEDDAIARHRAEHPAQPAYTHFAIIRIVDP